MANALSIPPSVDLTPTPEELRSLFDGKYRREAQLGWGPKTRLSFGYFNPDDQYEAIVTKLVRRGTRWADIGCGRDIFPSNPELARRLAGQCSTVLGIDPDPNVRENPFVNQRFEGLVEDYPGTETYDLVTLRMVAEHIVDPDHSVRKLWQLTAPGGLVVIYTPNRWSPIPFLTALVPNRWHHTFKRMLWDAQARDTFPTAFKMNTRKALSAVCQRHGLQEVHFQYLDDCRTFDRYRWLNYMELSVQRVLRGLGVRYPENCLVGVYRRSEQPTVD